MKKPLFLSLTILLLLACLAGCVSMPTAFESKEPVDLGTLPSVGINSPTVGITTPTAGTSTPSTRQYSWNGLSYTLAADVTEESDSNGVIYRDSKKSYQINIDGKQSSAALTAREHAEALCDSLISNGCSAYTETINGIPCIISEFGGQHDIVGVYVSNDYVWIITASTNDANISALRDQLTGYATSGIVTKVPAATEPPATTPPATQSPAPSVEYITVHAYIPENVTAPCCWAWLSSTQENAFAAWPGEAMTASGDWYTVEVPDWVDSVIINGNGGTVQTEDLTIEPGKDLWVVWSADGTAEVFYQKPIVAAPIPETQAPTQSDTDTVTVHAYVSEDWADPCCWAWLSTTEENVFEAWPGEAMTASGDWYTTQIPGWADSVIINANNGTAQTLDITIEPGKDVWIVLASDGTHSVHYSQPDMEDPAPPVEDSPDTITIHAYVNDDVGTPSCWAWLSTTQENVFAEWPGQGMTASGEHYTIEVPVWVDSIIFSVNDGTQQTEDIAIEPGQDIWVVWNLDTYYYLYDYEPSADEVAACLS